MREDEMVGWHHRFDGHEFEIAEDRKVKAKGQAIWLYVYFGNLYLAVCVCVCVCVHLLSMSQNTRWVPHWEYHLCCLSPLNSRFLIHALKHFSVLIFFN